jgi:site-specific DNA recombinase
LLLRLGTRFRLSSRMNAGRKRGRASSKHPSLLAGLLFRAEGVPFTPSHAVNHGRRYRYYVERSLLTSEAAKGRSARHQRGSGNGLQADGWRLPAKPYLAHAVY